MGERERRRPEPETVSFHAVDIDAVRITEPFIHELRGQQASRQDAARRSGSDGSGCSGAS